MLRWAGFLAAAFLPIACVPNESSREKDKQANPQPPPPPALPAVPPVRPAARPIATAVTPPPPMVIEGPIITEPFSDSFDRAQLGPDWRLTSNVWAITDGQMCGQGARNHPAWLVRRLPTNARIEFDALSRSPDGDLKVELWGDGRSAATSTSYTNASSYIAIFGGWKNHYHVLARIDEHAPNRPEVRVDPDGELNERPVEPNRSYHFKIERSDSKTVRWYVDDIEIITFTDPQPLIGAGHEHLGFNDWDVPVCFDNLKITPLPG